LRHRQYSYYEEEKLGKRTYRDSRPPTHRGAPVCWSWA
jgi:hypothetical protein